MKPKKKKNKQDSTDEPITQELKDRRNDIAMADWGIDYDELDPTQKRIVNRQITKITTHGAASQKATEKIVRNRKKENEKLDKLLAKHGARLYSSSRKKSKKVEVKVTKWEAEELKRMAREEKTEVELQKKQTLGRLLQTTTKFFGMDRYEIKQSHAGRELTKGDWYKIFNSIRRRAWAYGYNEQQIMISVGKILLCKLYDEEYANNCIFEKIIIEKYNLIDLKGRSVTRCP